MHVGRCGNAKGQTYRSKSDVTYEMCYVTTLRKVCYKRNQVRY